MAADCVTLIQGTRLRATLIDACGNPVGGASSTVVTDGFISVAMADNLESPQAFKVKNASGNFCVNQQSLPLLNWIDVTISMCQVAPELFHLLSGSPLIYDDSTPPVAVGFASDTDHYASASFALELWTNIGRPTGGAACVGGVTQYGYLLLPWLLEGTLENVTVDNNPLNFGVKAITASGNAWGVGPYNVINTKLGVPHPLLTPIPTTRHRHLQLTTLPPPPAVCGFQTLVLAS